MRVGRMVLAAAVLACAACGGGGGDDRTGAADVAAEAQEGAACDDGNPCTHGDRMQNGSCAGTPYECPAGKSPFCVARACDGRGGCAPVVAEGFCFVDGACFAAGARAPSMDCAECRPEADPLAWSPATGGGCSDGDICTDDDHCEDGRCVGTPADCDDKNPCTADSCDPKLRCVHVDAPGECDDQDPCTVGDSCEAGKCRPGAQVLDCDDHDPCTVDVCVPFKGCDNLPAPEVACDDKNQCTQDTCTPATGCAHVPLGGPCDDGNACTVGDMCEGTQCVPGKGAPDCDDGNPCTADSCHPAHGCIHANLSQACDDGVPCTENDVCLVGRCAGKKTASCAFCSYEPNPEAHKVYSLELGTGHLGGGMDLDDNPATCAPANACSNGIDNELGQLGVFANDGLKSSLDQGTVLYVFEFKNFSLSAPFTVSLLDTGLAETNPTCNFQFDECDYYPAQDSLDVDCKPIITFDNATVVGNVLRAGGLGYAFPLQANLIGGQPLLLGIATARVQASLTWDGDRVTGMEGFLGGGVAKEQLMDTLNKLPAWVFPMDKKTVLDLLDTLIVNDLDTDGDGQADAASINLKFKTIPANIVSP